MTPETPHWYPFSNEDCLTADFEHGNDTFGTGCGRKKDKDNQPVLSTKNSLKGLFDDPMLLSFVDTMINKGYFNF